MTDLHDHDDKIQVMNLIQDSIVPLSHAVLVVPREFFAAWRPRVARQRPDLRDNPPTVPLRDGFDFLGGRRLDERAIVCHDAGGPSRQPQNRDLVPWLGLEMRQDRQRPLRGFAEPQRSQDRKQTSQPLRPSSGQLDAGRGRGRWSRAWSGSCGQHSVKTSERPIHVSVSDYAAEHRVAPDGRR